LAGGVFGVFLLFVLGCGGREEQTAPEKSTTAASATEAAPVFNRDMHVIRELWKELQAVEDIAESNGGKKRQALWQALRERIDALEISAGSLSKSERKLLADIKRKISRGNP